MLSRVVPLAAAAIALAGCSKIVPEPVSGTQSIIVVVYNPGSETFSLQPENVTTLHDLRTMQGSVADVVSGARVSASFPALLSAGANTPASVQSTTVQSAGGPVDFDYFNVSGAIYPADADALNIATAYYELEQAYLFFQQYKVAVSSSVPLYYHPSLTVTTGAPGSVTDLGTTDPWLGYFVVPDTPASNWQAPGLQPGIIAYQYAQAVFAQQVFGNVGVTWLDADAAMSPGQYGRTSDIVRGLAAAFSDFFAAVIVNDPEFVHDAGATIDPTRQLDPPSLRCMTTAISDSLGLSGSSGAAPRSTYDPHALGSILSAVLYDEYEDRPDLQQSYLASVVAAMQAFGRYLQTHMDAVGEEPLTFADVINNIVPSIVSGAQSRLCNLLIDRLGAVNAINPNDVPACPDPQTPTPSCAQP